MGSKTDFETYDTRIDYLHGPAVYALPSIVTMTDASVVIKVAAVSPKKSGASRPKLGPGSGTHMAADSDEVAAWQPRALLTASRLPVLCPLHTTV